MPMFHVLVVEFGRVFREFAMVEFGRLVDI